MNPSTDRWHYFDNEFDFKTSQGNSTLICNGEPEVLRLESSLVFLWLRIIQTVSTLKRFNQSCVAFSDWHYQNSLVGNELKPGINDSPTLSFRFRIILYQCDRILASTENHWFYSSHYLSPSGLKQMQLSSTLTVMFKWTVYMSQTSADDRVENTL